MTNHPYTEIALLEGKLKAANDLLSTQGRLLCQTIKELDKEIAKRREAEEEIERRGECMERLLFALEDCVSDVVLEKFDGWFDSDGKVLPYSPDGTES